jgi:CRISPR/Cas system-associated exonuclease Cas4 (RecB family)
MFCKFEKPIFMPGTLVINEKEPSTLAKIVMEVESLTEEEKKLMLKQVRMRKALMMAEKLKGEVVPNNISLAEIVAEQKKMHKERKK